MNSDKRFLFFSASVLKLSLQLPKNRLGRHIADQLMRSGTSVGANVHEARSAESRADFIHKMQIALKEIRETGYWLAILELAEVICVEHIGQLPKECNELTAILVSSVVTAKRNLMANEDRIANKGKGKDE